MTVTDARRFAKTMAHSLGISVWLIRRGDGALIVQRTMEGDSVIEEVTPPGEGRPTGLGAHGQFQIQAASRP